MMGVQVATGFWDAVQDCLVKFHDLSRDEALQKVTEFWGRLAKLAPSQRFSRAEMPGLDDIIYHEEPWYIACNLVDCDKPLERHRIAYRQILEQHHLA
jgi:hypothetical protein